MSTSTVSTQMNRSSADIIRVVRWNVGGRRADKYGGGCGGRVEDRCASLLKQEPPRTSERFLFGRPIILTPAINRALSSRSFGMPKSRLRPDPVSCETCRTKKLKCSRVQPCSNCSTRGITCRFLVPPPPKAGPELSHDQSILPRLLRLESVVTSVQQQLRSVNELTSAPPSTASSYHSPYRGGQGNGSVSEDVAGLESTGTRDDTLVSILRPRV